MNAAGKVALCAGVVGLSAIAELLVPSIVLAQANSGAGVLQPPHFILTCEALGRIKSEEQYFADILFKKEAQDCATNPSLKVAYSSERWRAAIDSVAQSLETEGRIRFSVFEADCISSSG